MKNLEYYILFLCLLSILNLVSTSGYLEIKFISYENKHGLDSGKRHCDPTIDNKKHTRCDLRFTIKLNGQNGGVGPTWSTIKSITYHDQDSVHFGSFIGEARKNPFQLKFTRWHGILNLEIKVVDIDMFTTHDHVDTFTTSILVTADNVDRHHRIFSPFHGHDSVFQFSLRVACDANFLSPTCLERCTENQGQNICGATHSKSRCTSGSCRQESKVTIIVVPLVFILLLFAIAIITFRKRRKIRQFLSSNKDNGRIPQEKVKFENNLYVNPEHQDIGEAAENDNDFANKLYGLAENTSQRSSDQQDDGSVYDSLDSNNVSDVSENEHEENGRENLEGKEISTI